MTKARVNERRFPVDFNNKSFVGWKRELFLACKYINDTSHSRQICVIILQKATAFSDARSVGYLLPKPPHVSSYFVRHRYLLAHPAWNFTCRTIYRLYFNALVINV